MIKKTCNCLQTAYNSYTDRVESIFMDCFGVQKQKINYDFPLHQS